MARVGLRLPDPCRGVHPRGVTALILALLLGQGRVAPLPGVPLDAVVASVGLGRGEAGARTVLTRGDLEAEAAIALAAARGVEAARKPFPPELLAATLDLVIAEQLLHDEAEQLKVVRLDRKELVEAEEAFAERCGGREALARFLEEHELSETELRRVLRRGRLAGRYLESRFALTPPPGEAAVRELFEARGGARTAPIPAELRPALELEALRRQRGRLAQELVADLRRRAELRLLVDLRKEGAR